MHKDLSVRPGDQLASIDVEFLNMPVLETITIIIQTVYNHPTLPAQYLSETKKELHNGNFFPVLHVAEHIYVQVDGVSIE